MGNFESFVLCEVNHLFFMYYSWLRELFAHDLSMVCLDLKSIRLYDFTAFVNNPLHKLIDSVVSLLRIRDLKLSESLHVEWVGSETLVKTCFVAEAAG